jgi:RNA polymerase I-specific transcription initiation factor RRN7
MDAIPKDWGERLPGWAHRALLTRYARFNGSELHHAVMDLMLNYQEHYELIFPSAPVAPLLLVWVKDLALPGMHHILNSSIRVAEA